MILRLKRQQLNLLKEEARKAYPIEACAMLFGKRTAEETVVERVMVAPNRLRSTTRFEIDPETSTKAILEAEEEGLEFIALFHSHPAPSKPSPTDLKLMKFWGDTTWLILSSINDNLAAYQVKNDRVGEITIEVE